MNDSSGVAALVPEHEDVKRAHRLPGLLALGHLEQFTISLNVRASGWSA